MISEEIPLEKESNRAALRRIVQEAFTSPHVYFFFAKIGLFFWAYMQFTYPCMFILAWLMHSLLYRTNRLFYQMSMTLYFPGACLFYLYIYLCSMYGWFEY